MRGAWRSVVAFLLLALPLGLFLVWTETSLRSEVEERVARQHERTLRIIALEIGDRPLTDSLADRLGEAAEIRVSFIGPDGRVLGDSDVEADRLAELDDHDDRPEVRAARAEGFGFSRRPSRSVARSLFYAAIPLRESVLRIASPEPEALSVLGRTRRGALFFAGLSFLLLVLAWRPLGLGSAGRVTRLRGDIRALGDGRYEERGEIRRGPLAAVAREIEDAARSLAAREARTEETLAQLDAMLAAIDDGVAVVDGDGRVVRVNPAFEDWTGRREVVGRPIGTLFRHSGPRDVLEAALDGRVEGTEAGLGRRTARVAAVPLEEGAVLTIRDLTVTRRLEGMRRDFVANVSHELKTPLTAIRGFAEPLLEGDVDAAQSTEFLGRILANLDRMQHLVDDLLDLTRIESGGWMPEFREVEIGSAVERVWRRIEPLAAGRNLELRLDVQGPDRTLADPDGLEQILANLLDNAARYSPEGGTVMVTVFPVRDGSFLRLEVADDGTGIPAEDIDRVFERFYRVDAGRSRDAGGTGLGLSIVKHLVAAHGGTVGIESELGHGTTAWLELPIRDATFEGRELEAPGE
ncbi:MAG: sensor histidine kinase [Gemmatimonadota bacterium]